MATPYVDPPEAEADRPRDRRRLAVLWRLLPLLRPHRARFLLAFTTLCAASGVTLVYPWAARQAVDAGMGGKTTHKLDLIVLVLVGVFIVNAILVWLRHYSVSWLGERVVADLRGMVFDRVLTLPLAWFHERRSGELVGRLASDVTVIEGVVGSELSMALRNSIQMIGAMVMLFVIDVPLTLLMLAIVPPITLTTIYFGRRIRKMTRAVQDELARVSGQVQESVGAIATVQSFVREPYEAGRYRAGVEGAFHKTLALVRWRSWFFSTAMTAGYIGVAAVIWLGGRALIHGELTAGQLTSFFLYTFIVAGALADVAGLWGALQRAAGATDRLFAVIDTVPEVRDPEPADTLPLPPGKGALRFEGVSFAYPSRRGQPVFTDVTLDVAPGEIVALVGPSGAGKSTLLSLLYRFYDVDAGRVLFEGIDVRRLSLGELRRALAMVAQEPVLFSGTIRANIGYGREGASAAEIERAARDAYAHDFITGFPDGYDTVIGERGTKLSGGQKQRIALARALLANPRVLILDEATSNLDAESEAQVQAALARLMTDRTTIIVAHRLSTVRDADRIIVIEGARVVEQGRHDELMARRGTYHRLVEHQLIADHKAAS
ncbi:MAG TPA: ABC transporter transmembrane domain-containing protein [Kofleriaceae bacterium]|jgi:ABC transporter fused permease/ATP-binding protein|nr:ABC transporter transmembrane domain-containing protein [Kofleriaceae bacterium]